MAGEVVGVVVRGVAGGVLGGVVVASTGDVPVPVAAAIGCSCPPAKSLSHLFQSVSELYTAAKNSIQTAIFPHQLSNLGDAAQQRRKSAPEDVRRRIRFVDGRWRRPGRSGVLVDHTGHFNQTDEGVQRRVLVICVLVPLGAHAPFELHLAGPVRRIVAVVVVVSAVCAIHALIDLAGRPCDMFLPEAKSAVAEEHVDQNVQLRLRNEQC